MIALDSLRELLDEMRSMIERIDDESYGGPGTGPAVAAESVATCATVSSTSARSSPAREPACAHTTGGHAARPSITCRLAAIQCILDLDADLLRLRPPPLRGYQVDVETQVDTSGAFLVTTSTVGRELMFVISHTIHHNALIARLLDERAINMGPRFGLAPATPLVTCAR